MQKERNRRVGLEAHDACTAFEGGSEVTATLHACVYVLMHEWEGTEVVTP
jgi:hypothetical protein